MIKTIDGPDFYGPESSDDYREADEYDRLAALLDLFFSKLKIDFELSWLGDYQDGSALASVIFQHEEKSYEAYFSNFGGLFTIMPLAIKAIKLDNNILIAENSRIWDSHITHKLISFFSKEGYLYIDYAYAKTTLYNGTYSDFQNYTLYHRYFSSFIGLEKAEAPN